MSRRSFCGTALAPAVLVCLAMPILAQPDPRSAQLERNFDIREILDRPLLPGEAPRRIATDRVRDEALIARRKTAIESYIASGDGVRIVLNDFGWPKSLFHPLHPLTSPSTSGPEIIAPDFLASSRQILPVDARDLRLAGRHGSDGLTFLQFQQSYRGVDV